jgi:hypothetical protein
LPQTWQDGAAYPKGDSAMSNIFDLIDDREEQGQGQDGMKETVQRIRRDEQIKVKIVKIDVPFFDLVAFLMKLSLAAVPAAIIVFLFWTLLTIVAGGLFKSFFFRF